MLLLFCPYCQEQRSEEEFSYAGEAGIVRPPDPAALNDEEWGDYLYFRNNPRGVHAELWLHTAGCRRYLRVTRDTQSYRILETAPPGGPAPSSLQSEE